MTKFGDLHRYGLQVSKQWVGNLGDLDLELLMDKLLRAQSYRCGAPLSEVCINTEGKAKDEGSDGWTGVPTSADEWLGSSATCWQFKAGTAGQPSKLKKEIAKPIPRKTLSEGGRFVVVASGCTNGVAGERDRLKVLREVAETLGLPTDKIYVLSSEKIATWCNLHPAIALAVNGAEFAVPFSEFAALQQHSVAWQATQQTEGQLKGHRASLAGNVGGLKHVHIQGLPGVGKTRFALELCKAADWFREVVYLRQTNASDLTFIIRKMGAERDVRLVIIADEIQFADLSAARDLLDLCSGNIRLISVGVCKSPDSARIPAIELEPLHTDLLRNLITGWHTSMPVEHVNFVARFSGGYVKLAKLASDAVVRNPEQNAMNLLSIDQIRLFLDSMLGEGSRRSLHVVAVLTQVGWDGDVASEGKAVSSALGLQWETVQSEVQHFDSRYAIAPRGGRLRYISPEPLGIHLAHEAWRAHPDILRGLPELLPSDASRQCYFDRLAHLASEPSARQFSQEELRFFLTINQFSTAQSCRRWAAVVNSDRALGVCELGELLAKANVDERDSIRDGARRELVSALTKLAWHSDTFHDAAKSLAYLASAENEHWANNSTGTFLDLFEVRLGGTAVPYTQRLDVIRDLLKSRELSLQILAIEALSRVGQQRGWRVVNPGLLSEVQEREWQPTRAEHDDAVAAGLAELTEVARARVPELESALLNAARHVSPLFHDLTNEGNTIALFQSVHAAYPKLRESLRLLVWRELERGELLYSESNTKRMANTFALNKSLEDDSLEGQIRQKIALSNWSERTREDLGHLASRLAGDLEVLERLWPWLISGQADDSWRLGAAMAPFSIPELEDKLLKLAVNGGRDLRFLTGFLKGKSELAGSGWLDGWVSQVLQKSGDDFSVVFEACIRVNPTDYLLSQLIFALQHNKIGCHMAGGLLWGRWGEALSQARVFDVVRALMTGGQLETAIQFVCLRLRMKPEELDQWTSISVELVTHPQCIRNRGVEAYHWKKLAGILLPQKAESISGAILREQASKGDDYWHPTPEALEILQECQKSPGTHTWLTVAKSLEDPSTAWRTQFNLRDGYLDQIDPEEILKWVEIDVANRAPIIAGMANKDLSDPNGLAIKLLTLYGDNTQVAEEYLAHFVSGSWVGPASVHWQKLANKLDHLVKPGTAPKLRRWAINSQAKLKRTSESELQQEAERELRP